MEQKRGKRLAAIEIQPYHPSYAEETVAMWRSSKEKAIGQKEVHSFEDHVHFLNQVLSKDYQIYLAFQDGHLAGLVVFNSVELNQLYVANEYQGQGIGEGLLAVAKRHSSGSMFLYTFEVNKNAQNFYKKHGFVEVGRGYENEENLPDIKYEWKAKRLST